MPALILSPSTNAIDLAAEKLRNGGLVAFPTETVYGLGADATNAHAVARLYEAKGRPRFNPLIAHVPDLEAALQLVNLSDNLTSLAEAFWPGPLTLVAPRRTSAAGEPPVCDLATAGLETLAVRVPASDTARQLLEAVGGPLVAPSANRSGRPSPTTADHVEADLSDRIDLIIDDGPCPHGLESTIVAVLPDGNLTILRPGALPRSEIEKRVPLSSQAAPGDRTDAPLAPGQLSSHYAPDVALRLDARDIRAGEGLLAYGAIPQHMAEAASVIISLSPEGNLHNAATNLFTCLRALETAGPEAFAVMPIPGEGLAEAIRDRLARAAAPR